MSQSFENHPSGFDADVLVVGAGPSGLTLAAALGRVFHLRQSILHPRDFTFQPLNILSRSPGITLRRVSQRLGVVTPGGEDLEWSRFGQRSLIENLIPFLEANQSPHHCQTPFERRSGVRLLWIARQIEQLAAGLDCISIPALVAIDGDQKMHVMTIRATRVV